MMEADHVSEIALDALLQRIAKAQVAMIAAQTNCVRADEEFDAESDGSNYAAEVK